MLTNFKNIFGLYSDYSVRMCRTMCIVQGNQFNAKLVYSAVGRF